MLRFSALARALAIGCPVILILLAAGCTAPQAAQGPPADLSPAGSAAAQPASTTPATEAAPPEGTTTHGQVLNTPPRVLAFGGSEDRVDNGGAAVEVFRATIADDNAETDLAQVVLVGKGPERFEAAHNLRSADLQRRSEPTPDPDGWAVWDAAPRDGALQLALRFTYPLGATPGTYTWTLTVSDRAGDHEAAPQTDATRVDPLEVVEVAGTFAADGTPSQAGGWGDWVAAPGAQHVRSSSYLKVVHRVPEPGTRVLVDFGAREFAGTEDASWRVPLDGNLRFGWWEAEPGQAPAQGTFTWGEPALDGSVVLTFERPGTVLYVAYEVLQVPSPLPVQVYQATAAVTAA